MANAFASRFSGIRGIRECQVSCSFCQKTIADAALWNVGIHNIACCVKCNRRAWRTTLGRTDSLLFGQNVKNSKDPPKAPEARNETSPTAESKESLK